jgi:hypothetical protein
MTEKDRKAREEKADPSAALGMTTKNTRKNAHPCKKRKDAAPG